MARPDKTSPEAIARKERADEALQWRIKGLNYREIAAKMGRSESTVYRYVADAVENIPRQAAQVVFQIELDALHQAAKALDPLIADGDVKAIEQRLKLHDRMVKLYHLDTVHNETGDSGARSGLAALIDAVKSNITPSDVSEATRKP